MLGYYDEWENAGPLGRLLRKGPLWAVLLLTSAVGVAITTSAAAYYDNDPWTAETLLTGTGIGVLQTIGVLYERWRPMRVTGMGRATTRRAVRALVRGGVPDDPDGIEAATRLLPHLRRETREGVRGATALLLLLGIAASVGAGSAGLWVLAVAAPVLVAADLAIRRFARACHRRWDSAGRALAAVQRADQEARKDTDR